MEKKFTEEDSLRLINEMIAQVNSNIQKGAASTMILSGYSVAITAIINIILMHILPDPNMSFWIWSLMILLPIGDRIMNKRKDKESIVRTHIDRIIGHTWGAFGCATAVLFVVIFGLVYAFQTWVFTALFTPIILTMMGIAQYTTAVASKFRPFYWGVIAFWLGAVLCVVSIIFIRNADIQFIILAVCTIIGFVIPGHILNSKAKNNV